VSARIDPDTRPVLVVATTSAVLLAAVSFALSFAGLVQLAAWGHVPTRLAWCVPVMIDGAIAVYTLAVLVARARGERQWTAWAALALWTAVSVGGNAAHGWEPTTVVQRLVGTVVVALAPVAVLLATHTIADLIVARPQARDEQPATPTVQLDRTRVDELAARRRAPKRTASVHVPTTRSKITPEHRARIVELKAQGMGIRAIGREVGLSHGSVCNVLKAAAA